MRPIFPLGGACYIHLTMGACIFGFAVFKAIQKACQQAPPQIKGLVIMSEAKNKVLRKYPKFILGIFSRGSYIHLTMGACIFGFAVFKAIQKACQQAPPQIKGLVIMSEAKNKVLRKYPKFILGIFSRGSYIHLTMGACRKYNFNIRRSCCQGIKAVW